MARYALELDIKFGGNQDSGVMPWECEPCPFFDPVPIGEQPEHVRDGRPVMRCRAVGQSWRHTYFYGETVSLSDEYVWLHPRFIRKDNSCPLKRIG